MCEINKDLQFYTTDYSLVLNLDELGGVSGLFRPITNYGTTKDYSCKGCYHIPEPKVISLAFIIEWSPSTENEHNFTCFSGQIINQSVMILDWMLVNQKDGNNYAVNGSSFLYSSLHGEKDDKTAESMKPFPVSLKLLVDN